MKRLFTYLTIFLGFTAFEASAQTATCQDLIVQLDGSGNYNLAVGNSIPETDVDNSSLNGVATVTEVWQSFTATTDGVLHSFSVNFFGIYNPVSTVTISIYEDEGVATPALVSFAASAFSFSGVSSFIIPETIDLLAGSEYTFEIVDDNGDSFQLYKGPAYADGIADGAGTISVSDDLFFSTEVLARPDIDNGSLDATFGLASFGVDITSFDCNDLGDNTITLTVNNNNGDASTCTSTVTVQDTEAPTALCQNLTIYLDASGDASIIPADVDNGSNDNCAVNLSLDFTTFDCADVGANGVTLTVEDNALPTANSSNCSATITVLDTVSPTAVCQDFDLFLDGSGAGTLTVGNVNNGSSDNCGIASLAIDASGFTCGDLGVNTVTLTVTDINTNVSSCASTVTVIDNEAPSIICPADIIVCATAATGVAVDYTDVTGDDNCNAIISQTDVSGYTDGDEFPVGTTIQEWTNTDIAGNTTSCSFTVTVDAKPVADYSFSPACEGETTFFTDLSTIDPSSAIVGWQWDMNDGSSLIGLVDPAHVFADTGSYNVELIVTSTEGCTDTTTQLVISGSVPIADFNFVGACEGSVIEFTEDFELETGNLNYPVTYAWDFGDGNVSYVGNPDHIYAVNGTYIVSFTVISANGCEDVATASVEVFDSPIALFTATTVCDGGTTAFTNLSSGDGTLTYAWDFDDTNTSASQNPTNEYDTAGVYLVTLTTTNDDGCVDSVETPVTVNALPIVDFSFPNVCEGSEVSFANASSSGTYAWDFGNGSSSIIENPSETYLSAGTFNVELTITDANFCINSGTEQIEVYYLPVFTLTASDADCFGEATGSIVANPQGTGQAFQWDYSINSGPTQINDTFIGLAAGSYDITVLDTNGCELTLSTVVGQPSDTLGIEIVSLTDALCSGEFTGELSVEGTGGTAPYSYSIDAQALQAFGVYSGLDADDYDIQIVDNNNCVFDTIINVSEPDTLVLTLTASENLLCNGDNSGSIDVMGTGGVEPYQYNLDGGLYQMDGDFGGLSADDYIVSVLDANGCEDTIQLEVTEPGILMLSLLNSADANCFGESSGTIEVGAASGTPDYQYSIDGVSFVGSGLFQGLTAGSYTITVQDNNNCVDELTETILEPSLLTIETNSAPVACFGELTGEVEILADGGTPGPVLGFWFSLVSIDSGDTLVQNGGLFSDLASGTYLAVVADTNGCTASEGVIISGPSEAFDLSADITDALCLDSASGSVELIGMGGTPTYIYSDDNSNYVTSNLFSGFAAGTYTLYARDVNGCSDSIEFNVGEPATSVNITNILINDPACPNEASGTATVQATGGTPGYTYSGNGGNTFQANQILSGFNGGGHLVIVQDANGCEASEIISMTSPAIFDFTIDAIEGVECEGDLGGEISVTAVGGTPSYNYSLNGGAIQTNGTYTNLVNGTYTVAIMDVNGCMYSEEITVPAQELQPIADFDYNFAGTAVLFNNNSENGSSYLWEFGDDSTSVEENPIHIYEQDGEYNVTLTVTNGCGSISVTEIVSTTAIGIDEIERVEFSLFPNPASVTVNVLPSKTIDKNVIIEVFSVSGQLLKVDQINQIRSSEAVTIDVAGLDQGMYFLRLTANEQRSVLRFDITK